MLYVDIWFIYGAFSYGFEGQFVSFRDNFLVIGLQGLTQEMRDALSLVMQTERSILKTFLRFFVDDSDDCLCELETYEIPRYVESTGLLVFSELRGKTLRDWEVFLAQVNL